MTTTAPAPHSMFDFEQYIGQYSNGTKIARLLFAAKHSERYGRQAATMAIQEMKKGINTAIYKESCDHFTKKFGTAPEFTVDTVWVVRVDQEAQNRLEKLEMELNSYKTNLIRESTRMGYNELGDFYFARGDLQNSLKSYLRTREYCTAPKHIVTMCLKVIRVSIHMGNYGLVVQYVNKAEQSMEDDPVVRTKFKIANALALLDASKYKVVAKILLEDTDIALGNQFSDVISCQDVAIYGALCALATFDRTALKNKCLLNPGFKNFLELVPVVRDLLNDFYESKYTSCLQYLERLLPDLSIDIHLFKHVHALYASIRNKALIQYVSPFTSVDLKRMAAVFNTDVSHLEKELARLIVDKQIKARIDSHKKILYARMTDQRNNTFQSVVELGNNFVQETENNLLRLNMQKYKDFQVVSPKRTTRQQLGAL